MGTYFAGLCVSPVGLICRDYHQPPETAGAIVAVIATTAAQLQIPACIVAGFAAHESSMHPWCYSDKFYYSQTVLKRPDDTAGWPARTKVTFLDWGHDQLPAHGIHPDDNVWGSYGLFQTLYETAVHNGFPRSEDPWDLFDMNINARFFACEIEKALVRSRALVDVAAIYNSGSAWDKSPSVTRTSYVPSVIRLATAFNDGYPPPALL